MNRTPFQRGHKRGKGDMLAAAPESCHERAKRATGVGVSNRWSTPRMNESKPSTCTTDGARGIQACLEHRACFGAMFKAALNKDRATEPA